MIWISDEAPHSLRSAFELNALDLYTNAFPHDTFQEISARWIAKKMELSESQILDLIHKAGVECEVDPAPFIERW